MVRVDERLKQATEQAAMDDQRSVASLIQKLIVDFLTESGYIDGKRPLSANNFQNGADDDPDDDTGANGTDRADGAHGENDVATSKRALANGNGHLDREEQNRVNLRVQSLTPREREVLELFVAGNTDDKIAGYLNTSAKNVQASRAVITEKIGADSLPYLIRMIVRRELQDLTALNVNP
jgi:DNA-binding CsgD family transcriptional regulator